MKPKHKPSIRWGVFSGFMIFTVIVIALLWILQILMLDTFYKNFKIREIRSAADRISYSLEDEDLSDVVSDITHSKEINVLITAESGLPLLLSPYSQNSVIFRGRIAQYGAIYRETLEVGGTIFQAYNDNLTAAQSDEPEHMILAKTVTISNGSGRLILLHSNLTPVDSTVETLRYQLICVTVIMLILGSILAMILATRLTKPIIKINQSAKTLGSGIYETAFSDAGFKEISELANTMNSTAEELLKVENLRRELIANVSHDLRTPLTMIEGYSEMMRDIPGENTPENVQIIIDETSRLTRLVNDMLDLSKLQTGAIPLSCSVFSITENLENTITRFSKLADFSFTFEYDENLYVYADPSKISQVVYNLINNAIIHSGENKTILVRQTKRENHVRVEIADNGPGIPADKLEDIWNRYYKADRTEKNAKGTGLGLSIVKTVLDLHHVSYGVQSTLGKGSTFWFELAREKAPEQEKTE